MLLKKAELVDFNPAKREHRAAVRAFLKRTAWSDSPIRFRHDPEYSSGSVADQVQSKLLAYYLGKEKYEFPQTFVPRVFVGTIHNLDLVPVAVEA
jgi:hypothetical protein